MIFRNRHMKITYFLNAHSYSRTAIPMTIKKNATALFLFGSFHNWTLTTFTHSSNHQLIKINYSDTVDEINNIV
jgi:hypothetical protein